MLMDSNSHREEVQDRINQVQQVISTCVQDTIRAWPDLMGRENAINQVQQVISTCEDLLTELGVERNKLVQNPEGDKQ